METISPKIIAAISTAVHAYREEQKALLLEKQEVARQVIVHADRINLWAIAGRQDLMLQRRIWQQRLH